MKTNPSGFPAKETMGGVDSGIGQERGNSRAYALSRLERDFPRLFERVKAGLMSANRAAIQAGFRAPTKPKTRVEKCLTLWKKMTDREKKVFLKEIGR